LGPDILGGLPMQLLHFLSMKYVCFMLFLFISGKTRKNTTLIDTNCQTIRDPKKSEEGVISLERETIHFRSSKLGTRSR